MSEIKSGIRSILSNPLVYDLLQNLLGGSKARKRITSRMTTAGRSKTNRLSRYIESDFLDSNFRLQDWCAVFFGIFVWFINYKQHKQL